MLTGCPVKLVLQGHAYTSEFPKCQLNHREHPQLELLMEISTRNRLELTETTQSGFASKISGPMTVLRLVRVDQGCRDGSPFPQSTSWRSLCSVSESPVQMTYTVHLN